MKTVRTIIYNLINVYQPYPKLITEHKEAIDQALKEIEELLVEVKPEKREPTLSAFKAVPKSQMVEARSNTTYNQAIDDYEKNIKKVIGGK